MAEETRVDPAATPQRLEALVRAELRDALVRLGLPVLIAGFIVLYLALRPAIVTGGRAVAEDRASAVAERVAERESRLRAEQVAASLITEALEAQARSRARSAEEGGMGSPATVAAGGLRTLEGAALDSRAGLLVLAELQWRPGPAAGQWEHVVSLDAAGFAEAPLVWLSLIDSAPGLAVRVGAVGPAGYSVILETSPGLWPEALARLPGRIAWLAAGPSTARPDMPAPASGQR